MKVSASTLKLEETMRPLRLNLLRASLVSIALAAMAVTADSYWGDRSADHSAPWSLSNLFALPEPYGIAKTVADAAANEKLTLPQRFEFDFATSVPEYRPPPSHDPIAELIDVSVPLPTPRPAVDRGNPITWALVNDTNDVLTSLVATGLDEANKSVENVSLLGGKWNSVEPGALAVAIIDRDLAGCGLYLMAATLQKSDTPVAAVVDVCSVKDRTVPLTEFVPLPRVSADKGA